MEVFPVPPLPELTANTLAKSIPPLSREERLPHRKIGFLYFISQCEISAQEAQFSLSEIFYFHFGRDKPRAPSGHNLCFSAPNFCFEENSNPIIS